MLPLMAKEMAFMNSVVLGTRANSVTPKSFSGILDPFSTTSTTSTRISGDVRPIRCVVEKAEETETYPQLLHTGRYTP
jgi:hypothetical protein